MSDITFYGELEGEKITYVDFSPSLLSYKTRILADVMQELRLLHKEKSSKSRLTHINTISWEENSSIDPALYEKIQAYGLDDPVYVYRDFEKAPKSYRAIHKHNLLSVVDLLHRDGYTYLVPIRVLRDDINPDIIPILLNGLDTLDALELSNAVYTVLSRGRIKESGYPGFLSERYAASLLGISQSMIHRHKFIATNLIKPVKDAYLQDLLPYSKMRALALAPKSDQLRLLEVADGLSQIELEARIACLEHPKKRLYDEPYKRPKLRTKKAILEGIQDAISKGDRKTEYALRWVLSQVPTL